MDFTTDTFQEGLEALLAATDELGEVLATASRRGPFPTRKATDMSIARKTVTTAAAVLAGLGAVAIPATANAATTTQNHTYRISVNPGVLAGGQNTITARVKVANPEKSVRSFWSRSTVQQVVRQGVNNGYQKPYMSEGFRCTPTLDGSMNASTARFTCRLQGADVPTTVTLTFTAPYLPPTAG